jgi:hypothetical protein
MAAMKRGLLVVLSVSFLQPLLIASIEAAKVAIIGSGVAGSSAAFFLHKEDPSLEVHVFEKHEYVGGRVKDVFLSGDRFEAGASIIHRANKHMMSFAQVNAPVPGFDSWSSCNLVLFGRNCLPAGCSGTNKPSFALSMTIR